METYKCNKCGMAVNATCAKCKVPLKNDHLDLDDGSVVQISTCMYCMSWKDKISTMLRRRHVLSTVII